MASGTAYAKKLIRQGYKPETVARMAGVSLREARQLKHTFVANPPLPRPPKPKPVTSYSASQEAALDTSEAHYIKVRWAAKDALAESLRKKREAIAAARQ